MWKKYLSIWIIISGVLGYLLAYLVQHFGIISSPETSEVYQMITLVKEVFFSALKMLVTPIVFVSLLAGMIQISELSHLGSLGRRTLSYYMSTTTIAIVIGLIVVFFIHPWESEANDVADASHPQAQQHYQLPKTQIKKDQATTVSVIRNMSQRILVNPVDAFVKNNILGIVFWAFLIGIAFIMLGSIEPSIVSTITQANLVLSKILSWVINFAPLGVFAIAFTFQFQFKSVILWQMLSFCLVVLGATLVHGALVLPVILRVFTKIGYREFFSKASKPLLLALGTSSSLATLPVSMSTCEENFGVKKKVSSFVLPLGATMNMDGTALFEGVAAVFLAYIFGMELSNFQMISIFFMAVVSSIGAPGMPSGSMSGMQMVLLAVGIPLEGIGVLMVVEKPLDTFRTAVNVEGDIIGALVVNELSS